MNKILEAFGEPIGNYAGEYLDGVRNEVATCPDCGMMPINGKCGCSAPAGSVCPSCGMMPINGQCNCKKHDSCSCGGGGMLSQVTGPCECGMNEAGIEEVAPPGHEKMVMGLKKAKGIKNPWAVAWSHYNKKHPGGRGKRHK
jgi:hypothetical protein